MLWTSLSLRAIPALTACDYDCLSSTFQFSFLAESLCCLHFSYFLFHRVSLDLIFCEPEEKYTVSFYQWHLQKKAAAGRRAQLITSSLYRGGEIFTGVHFISLQKAGSVMWQIIVLCSILPLFLFAFNINNLLVTLVNAYVVKLFFTLPSLCMLLFFMLKLDYILLKYRESLESLFVLNTVLTQLLEIFTQGKKLVNQWIVSYRLTFLPLHYIQVTMCWSASGCLWGGLPPNWALYFFVSFNLGKAGWAISPSLVGR